MTIKLNHLHTECLTAIKLNFNIQPIKSNYCLYSNSEWKKFCQSINGNSNSLGIYLPRHLSAHLNQDSEFLPTNFFHEFFGHGLFCEYTPIGKEIVNLEQKLSRIEKEISKEGPKSPFYKEYGGHKEKLKQFLDAHFHNYEGFAMWMEHYLADLTGNLSLFKKKMNTIGKDDRILFEYFKDCEKRLTTFGFMSQIGFPKSYDGKKVVGILKKLYGNNFNDIDFVVLYGSKKPESDIDLFVVSKHPSHTYFNSWLDIYELNNKEFEKLASLLDISITDPLFSGDLIYGDRNYFENIKNKILNQTMSSEIIHHNLLMSEDQKKRSLRYIENSREQKLCESYVLSYLTNAEELQKGNKILTLTNMKNKYQQINPSS